MSAHPARQPVAAGKYYASAPNTLAAQIGDCLESPAAPLLLSAPDVGGGGIAQGQLRGLIVPHGAYQDSGRVAAAAFALLQAQYGDARPLRTIILGTNHFILQPAACLSSAQSWATPLGSMLVDAELNAELNLLGIPYSDGPHRPEHSIENQLPFLQHVTGMHCQIAPVSVGWLGGLDEVERVAAAVVAALRRHPPGAVLLLATNDFTHAGPSYGEPPAAPWMTLREHAIWRDSPLLHAIVAGSPEGFLDSCATVNTSLCGRWPVAVFLRVAEVLGWDVQLLSYAPSDLYVQSGDINGFAVFAAMQRLT